MKLVYNWREILKRAWSVRLVILAAILSGLEVVMPYFDTFIPRNVFAILSFIVTAAALVARITAQPELHK